MNTTPSPAAPLRLPSGINYECIQCGRSCGEFWEIQVEPELVESIRRRDPAALQGVSNPADPVVDSPYTPGQAMMRQQEGRCCMQAASGLCTLHAAFGADAKPNVCRSFPYRFIETPSGIFTGLSFACTAVLGNLGPAVDQQAAAIDKIHTFTVYKRKVENPPELVAGVPLDWEQYAKIETDLNSLLERDIGPFEQRVLAQSVYLVMLSKYLRKARIEAGLPLSGPEAHAKILDHFREQMSAGNWETIRRISGRKRRSPLLRRMSLSVAHDLRNLYGTPMGRRRAYLHIFGIYFKSAAGLGALQFPGLDRPIAHKKIEATHFDPNTPEIEQLLTRYFRHRLFRKDLLVADEILWGHHLQMLHWGLIQWYAAATARGAGRETVRLDDIKEAIHKVEKFFVMHSTFEKLFGQYPLLRGFLDRMFMQPLYAFSMTRGNWSK